MKTLLSTLTLTLVLWPAIPARAQGPARELVGELFSIEQGENVKRFIPGVKISVREVGNSGLTNDDGLFRVQLPPWAQPGVEVTLRPDKKGYAIASPLFGKHWPLPTAATDVVEVRLLPEGSKLFWTHERIEAFIEHAASEAAKKPKRPNAKEDDLSASIFELGRHYGFTPEEVRREIGKWMEAARKDVTDFRKQGMVAFAEKKFRLAAENFRRSAEENEGEAAEKLRAAAKDRELSGDSFSGGRHFQEALKEYRTAQKVLSVYHEGLGALGIKVYPEYAADARQLASKIATARSSLGEIVAGPDSRDHLEEAVQEYKRLVSDNPKSSNPRFWARTQNNLGLALRSLGERVDGAEGVKRLSESVDAYRQALTVSTRDDYPQQWALTQNNLGNALRLQGERVGGAEGMKRLREAVEAYRQALTVFTRDDYPQQWALTQNNLGNALASQGVRVDGAEGVKHLGEAVEAYRQALTVRTRDDLPQDWAMTQSNLGSALASQGVRVGGAEGVKRLGEAVEAFRQALTVLTRDDLPQQWAATQSNLGSALASQSVRVGGAEGVKRLGEAVEAYRQALTIRTRNDFPQQWARTQNNLGAALQSQGARLEGAEGVKRLREAVEAYREALKVYTRDDVPQKWALTQNNLGAALQSQGARLEGAEGVKRLGEAVEAFRQTLTVHTRDDLPQQWARTQNNLGDALRSQGARLGGAEGVKCLGEAVEAYRQALTVRTRDVLPYYWAMTQRNLGGALQVHVIVSGFPACLQQIDQIARQAGIRNDPVAGASLQTLAVVCQVGMDRSAEASRSFAGLVALVERQPDDFHLVWNWTPLRSFLTRSEADAIKARRMTLLKLLDAVARENRKAILDGLKAVQGEFTAKADGLEKAPREP